MWQSKQLLVAKNSLKQFVSWFIKTFPVLLYDTLNYYNTATRLKTLEV